MQERVAAIAKNFRELKSNPYAEFHGRTRPGCYGRRMSATITTALGGLRASSAQFENATKNVVKAFEPESKQDASTAIVDAKQSEVAFKANLAMFKTADKMMGDLIDITA